MAQDLTFGMLTHTLWSTCNVPNLYVTILLMFLQTIIWHLEGLSALKCAIPWEDLAVFLTCVPHVPSTHIQNDKLDKNSIFLEDWAMHRMAWVRQVFEHGCWEGNGGHLMEMEMPDTHNAESINSTWEEDNDNDQGDPHMVAYHMG